MLLLQYNVLGPDFVTKWTGYLLHTLLNELLFLFLLWWWLWSSLLSSGIHHFSVECSPFLGKDRILPHFWRLCSL